MLFLRLFRIKQLALMSTTLCNPSLFNPARRLSSRSECLFAAHTPWVRLGEKPDGWYSWGSLKRENDVGVCAFLLCGGFISWLLNIAFCFVLHATNLSNTTI